MGTNYYARLNHCECCGRYDETHVCKSLRLFRGYRRDPRWPDDPDPAPVGVVESWQDWKQVLTRTGVRVYDEYGREHDTQEFIAGVEATPQERRGTQMRWLIDHCHPLARDWVDPEGFDFHDGEFR
jgi:hypothetical protein